MFQTAYVGELFCDRDTIFKRIRNATVAKKMALAFSVACLTGLLAQVKLSIPWTPVPITGQTFVVLLSGVLLGGWWGGISQAIYLAIGASGIPWFSGWTGGIGVLIGPTGGYLIGFVLASLFLGYCSDKYFSAQNYFPMIFLMLLANFLIINVSGLVVLAIYLHILKGAAPSIFDLLKMGTVPFIIGDIIKILAAASVAKALSLKQS